MAYLTESEKLIIMLLKRGMNVSDIAVKAGTSTTDISHAITSICSKAQDIEEDVIFLRKNGFLRIENDALIFIPQYRNPKALEKWNGEK